MDYLSGDLELSLQPREDQVSYIAHRADRPADDTHAIFYPLGPCYRSGPSRRFSTVARACHQSSPKVVRRFSTIHISHGHSGLPQSVKPSMKIFRLFSEGGE
jgi:hypothetical protein